MGKGRRPRGAPFGRAGNRPLPARAGASSARPRPTGCGSASMAGWPAPRSHPNQFRHTFAHLCAPIQVAPRRSARGSSASSGAPLFSWDSLSCSAPHGYPLVDARRTLVDDAHGVGGQTVPGEPRLDQPPEPEPRRRRKGPDWFWAIAGVLGFGQPIVDREKMYGDDPRSDPYRHDFDPNRPDKK